jgi:hypothetical protein
VHAAQRLHEGHGGGTRKKLIERPERRFYFRLALERGISVDQLLDTTDSLELAEWIAYWELEPFGDHWEQTAAVCETVALSAGAKSADRNIWRPTRRRDATSGQSEEQMALEFAKIEAFLKSSQRKQE